jgi:DNA-binding response OmpR family regulator
VKILIAEDDPTSQTLLSKFLGAKGHEVVVASNGEEAIEQYAAANPDIVLLDVMMPKVDGWGVLENIRGKGDDTPVIMVSVKDTTEDKVKGLSAGVDDYITKPFDLLEVEARVEAVMRRFQSDESSFSHVGPLEIDDEKKEARIDGKVCDLSPKEYDLLRFLASKPGRVFSQDEILEEVWSGSTYAGSEDVKKYVYLLRNKLDKNHGQAQLIATVRGFGYKLNV